MAESSKPKPGLQSGSHTPESILSLAGTDLARAVYRTANALLANAADAEEVTLDVLVSLRKKLGTLGEGGLEGWLAALPGWLDRAAVNKAKGRAKKRKHHSGSLDELGALTKKLAETETKQRATALLVKEVLGYLPKRHRFVFVLKYGLGHDDAGVSELAGVDAATVERTLATVEQKLREFGAHHSMPKAMLEGMDVGVDDNPLRDYMEAFGRADAATETRLEQRFAAYLREDAPQLELSGDYSFHDQQLSGVGYRLDDVVGASAGGEPGSQTSPELEPEPEPLVAPYQSRRGVWVLGTVAALAVGLMSVALLQMSNRLAELDETIAAIEPAVAANTEERDAGPLTLEPGSSVELAHYSRAQLSDDAVAELVRNDDSGAEFKLTAGSVSVHGKAAKDAEWAVTDGRYLISAQAKAASRFRVSHTETMPEVEVYEGKVRVSGGLVGVDGVEVTSASHTLDLVMRERGKVAVPADATSPELASSTAADAVYARALALRETDEAGAETLLREIVDRGGDDWISELAFEQLRTLVAPSRRVELQQAYVERFPGGQYAEPFDAIACQAIEDEDEAKGCWEEFALTYPNSLYGP